MKLRDTVYVGVGEEALPRFIGQKVWLASGSPPLTLVAILEAGAVVTVEWLDDDFEVYQQDIPAIHLRAYETRKDFQF